MVKSKKLDINSKNESMPKKTPKSIGGKIPDARIRNLGHRAQRRMNLQTNVIRKTKEITNTTRMIDCKPNQ